jgi:hypothetical protein
MTNKSKPAQNPALEDTFRSGSLTVVVMCQAKKERERIIIGMMTH